MNETATPDAQTIQTILDLQGALIQLVELHHDWEPGGRPTKKFCELNKMAIANARRALALLSPKGA